MDTPPGKSVCEWNVGSWVSDLTERSLVWRIVHHQLPHSGEVYDFGIEVAGSLAAGLALAEICMAGHGNASLVPGEIDGVGWPHVSVVTDCPVPACLLSQYAGWQIKVGRFFGMGSGPMRAAYAGEELFDRLGHREQAEQVVGVLETGRLPDADVFAHVAEKCGVAPQNVTLCVAPTASQAGNVQVVARSVETAMHKLYELGFDVWRVESGYGVAPLPPVAADDMTGIGRTNDAILYGGRVTLWVRGDDDSIAETGPQVPAAASDAYGKPFLEIFEEAGRDFYKIDPHLFSPAEIVFQNLDSGRVHRFGRTNHAVLVKSFGL
ncbi:MAG: methenyltetrahydromethanopterin cyclohydrolase [Planctomycetaceae bacterium]